MRKDDDMPWIKFLKHGKSEMEGHKNEQESLYVPKEDDSGCRFKNYLQRTLLILRDTRGEGYIPQIPGHIRKEIARCILPDIIAYYESEEGQREYEKWKKQNKTEINNSYSATAKKSKKERERG